MLTDKFRLYPFVCVEQVGFPDTLLTLDLGKGTIPTTLTRFCLNSLFFLVFFDFLPETSHCLAVFRHPTVGDRLIS